MYNAQIIVKTREIPNADGEILREDKNGKTYKLCAFSMEPFEYVNMPGRGMIKVYQKTREVSVNLYEESYLDQKEQFGFSLPVNTPCFGDIVTRNVAPYEVPDRRKDAPDGAVITVNTFTTVVFQRTDKPEAFEADVVRAFRSKGHELLTSTPISKVSEGSEAPVPLQA